MIDAFYLSPWPGALCWAALFVSDMLLTVTCARMYQAGVRERFVFEGSYELTPYHQADIDALRAFSPRFLFALVAAVALQACLWWLSVGNSVAPMAYEAALGAMILIQLTIHVRHIRNYFLFRAVLAGEGIEGRMQYARPTHADTLGGGALLIRRALRPAVRPDAELVRVRRRHRVRNRRRQASSTGEATRRPCRCRLGLTALRLWAFGFGPRLWARSSSVWSKVLPEA